jgi:hypothetical protein
MAPQTESDLLIDKMFEAAVKEMFSQLARKHDRERVFQAWVNFAKKGFQPIPPELQWHKGMTLAEALKSLETYFQTIEASFSVPPIKGKE